MGSRHVYKKTHTRDGVDMSTPVYEFDDEVKESIVSLLCKDTDFCKKTGGLIQDAYFDNDSEKILVRIAIRHFEKYDECPSDMVIKQTVMDLLKSKKIRKDLAIDLVHKIKSVFDLEVKNRSWILDHVCEFARQQAFENTLVEAATLIAKTDDKDRFDKISDNIIKAKEVGTIIEEDDEDDFFKGVEKRKQERLDVASGKLPPAGITTGIPELDGVLDHRGYGRKELSVWMGPPKYGKSFALIQAAASAVLAGFTVLHVTIENSRDVTNTRYDAFMSQIDIKKRYDKPHEIASRVGSVASNPKTGRLFVREFPSGQFAPRDMRKLLDYYAAKGIMFDMVVVDYLDIMAPDVPNANELVNHKNIWVAMRGIAVVWNIAMVTATQTNRTGATAAVARATDVAESFDKIRTADIVFSINRSDDEKAEGKARIYLAAGRNQEDGAVISVTQNLGISRSVDKVESIE